MNDIPDNKLNKVLNTRFGELKVNFSNLIHFSEGIIGLPNLSKFVLADFPSNVSLENFKILQPLEDEKISFVTLPIFKDQNNLYGGIIEEKDVIESCESLKINLKNIILLLIVNLKTSENNEISFFTNWRAPVFIDTDQLKGYQYILSNNNYEISKKL